MEISKMELLTLLIGAALLVFGTYQLVRGTSYSLVSAGHGASAISNSLLVIGLALGTPQLLVAVQATQHGYAQMALGTAIGATVIGIFFVIGVSALRAPLSLNSKPAKLHLFAFTIFAIAVYGFAYDLTLSRIDGIILLSAGTIYGAYAAFLRRKNDKQKDGRTTGKARASSFLFWHHLRWVPTSLGLGCLALSMILFIPAVESTSLKLGLNEFVFGASLVAFVCALTLLLFSQVLSTIKQDDYMLNILFRWCIFNVAIVTGLVAILANGLSVSKESLDFFLLAMVGSSIIILPFLCSEFRLKRIGGTFFVLSGIAVLTYPIILSLFPESIAIYIQVSSFSFLIAGFVFVSDAFRDVLG